MKSIDGNGNTPGTATYDVYGANRTQSGNAFTFNFAGEQTDATGLQYLRARYYDPATGTFMSRDPLTHAPGYAGSPQGYAGANPVMHTDPGGLRFAPDEGLAEQGGGYGRTEDLTPDDGFDLQAYCSPQNEAGL
ncbi:MAG: RHS repeat-associated core domain-containing protein [Dehalococcoidia bacterium]|nr:RHS repeat-associated core domain-containing protein [Dehalococcoidia bacterium]